MQQWLLNGLDGIHFSYINSHAHKLPSYFEGGTGDERGRSPNYDSINSPNNSQY